MNKVLSILFVSVLLAGCGSTVVRDLPTICGDPPALSKLRLEPVEWVSVPYGEETYAALPGNGVDALERNLLAIKLFMKQQSEQIRYYKGCIEKGG